MEDFFSRFQAITGVSKYSNSEVITPLNIVKDMVELLPADVFNPDAKFLDPAVKSGRFLAEIYRRLFDSPLLSHMNEAVRKEHILKNQLYGLATSAAAAAIVRKQLYDDATIAGNIVYTEGKVTKELIQGAFNDMKFDVVIGNPPYNRGMDIDFVKLGFDLSKQYTVMITPAKWQTAEADQKIASKMTYGEFREQIVPHMSHVCFYDDTFEDDNFDAIYRNQVEGNSSPSYREPSKKNPIMIFVTILLFAVFLGVIIGGTSSENPKTSKPAAITFENLYDTEHIKVYDTYDEAKKYYKQFTNAFVGTYQSHPEIEDYAVTARTYIDYGINEHIYLLTINLNNVTVDRV